MAKVSDYVGNAAEFPILKKWDFFNHAGVSPVPHRAAEAMRKFAGELEEGSYLQTTWYQDVEALRESAAAMIGAHRDEICFIKNTSEGLATVAGGVAWKAGERIVTTGVEYPANMYPWMDAAKRFGLELDVIAEEMGTDGCVRVPLEKILKAAGHPRTRLVALSHVEYASGQRHDLARIGAYCREHGKLLSVDAIQSLGAVPVNVAAMNIDFLSADGHKWLLGPEGAGIFYCRRELLAELRPLIMGWMNVVNPGDYSHYHFDLKSDAGRFECGSYNVAGLLGLKASLELLSGLGPELAARVKALTDHLTVRLGERGYRVASPRDGDAWSGIVCFDRRGLEPDRAVAALRKEHRIEVMVRAGRIRCAAHFYNTEQQLDRMVDVLDGISSR